MTRLNESERRERLHLVNRLGWQAAEQAEQMLKAGEFKGWSHQELGERYRLLCSQLDNEHRILCSSGYRIDDPYIEFERTHGAEIRALRYSLYHGAR